MAVRFNVPASPKRSVFEIDQFLGVDLTNNGTNIDEHHSPNALNMTRYVPSKVRKRMGFSDKILFTDEKNLNIVLNTSDELVEYEITDDYVKIYDLADYINAGERINFKFEYECDGDVDVALLDDSETHSVVLLCRKGLSKAQISRGATNAVYTHISIKRHGVTTNPSYIRIKKLTICKKIEGSIDDLVWSKSPYDYNAKIVVSDKNEPIYGCHILKNGQVNIDRVTNVNRLIGTSGTERTLIDIRDITYTLADPLPKNTGFEFGITARGTGLVYIDLLGTTLTFDASETEQFFYSNPFVEDKPVNSTVRVYTLDPDAVIHIKNAYFVYARTGDYIWTPSPEDEGKSFPLEDVYSFSQKNYATISEDSKSGSANVSGEYSATFNLANSSDLRDMTYVSFGIYTTSSAAVQSIQMRFRTSSGSYIQIVNSQANYNNDRYTIFLSPITSSFKALTVVITTESGAECSVSVKDVEVHKATRLESFIKYSSYYIYHVGSKMYLTPNDLSSFKVICNNANRTLSSSWQIDKSIYILDSKNLFVFDIDKDEMVAIDDDTAFIPTVTIGKDPQGGGNPYYDLNLLQAGFYEEFYVSNETYASGTKTFYLSFQNLDNNKEVKAWVLSHNAAWIEKVENVDFTVDRANGIITFINAISPSPVGGTDNVRILAYRTVEGYADRIRNCSIGTLFGVNGSADRLFLSGNPDYPNYDWYSEQYNPTYFPDTGYSTLGIESSAIVGYAIVNNYLTTFKDENEPSQSAFIREGNLVTDADTKISKPQFRLINTLQGAGAIAKRSFGYLQTEPLFLTRSGIHAITAQDITGEKYGQNRSFYLNGWLTEEKNLEDAYAVIHNDMYLLSVNEKIYALDGLQPIRTDKSEPYATRQYVGFYWEGIPANCLWVDNQSLWFGTKDGRVCQFSSDVDALESYNDNGKAIECCWETPDLDGRLFYKNKSFRYIAIRMMAALKTSVRLWTMARGAWNFIKEDSNAGIFFDFENFDFEALSFSTDRTDKVAHSKIRVKKVDKARFKIENVNVNEPFGLTNLALEYVESGNYKG